MIIALSLLIAFVGLVIYAISNNGKAQTLGLSMFQCGLLAFLLCFCLRGGEKMLGILAH